MPNNEYNSRNAPKFVVRFRDDKQRDRVIIAAENGMTSMNSWIQRAIEEKLCRGMRIDRLLDAAERGLEDAQ